MADTEKNLTLPYFCRGTQEQLEAALAEGGIFENLNRIVWCYVTGGDNEGSLLFVDPEKNIHEISKAQRDALDERVSALEGTITEQVETMNELKETQDSQAVIIVNLDDRLTIAENTISGLNTSVASINEEITGINSDIENLRTDVNSLNDTKADKATTLSGYGITDAYTRTEVDDLMGDLGDTTVREYVANATADTLEEAKAYTEELLTSTYEEI